MYIFRLEMYIFRLEIYISKLEMKLSGWIDSFSRALVPFSNTSRAEQRACIPTLAYGTQGFAPRICAFSQEIGYTRVLRNKFLIPPVCTIFAARIYFQQ